MRTFARVLLVLAVTAALPLATATPASAGGPTRLTLTGPGLATTVVIPTSDDRFHQLTTVVFAAGLEWGNARDPLPQAPVRPGPAFVMVVDLHDIPTYRYELHPDATGGPHIFVPAEQPRKEMAPPGKSGWYRSGPEMITALRRAQPGSQANAAAATPATDAATPTELAVRSTGVQRRDATPAWPWLLGAALLGLVTAAVVARQRRRLTGR